MSRVRANQITNQAADGAPTVQNGLVISGVTTSTTFSGSGASLTNLNASNIASGTVPTARLGSGTANSSTFLRGDSTFAAVTSTTINNNADNRVITGSGTANTLNGESGLTFDGTVLSSDQIRYASGGNKYHGHPRSVVIGYSGSNYANLGMGWVPTSTNDQYTSANSDYQSRLGLYDGLQIYGSGASVTSGQTVTWKQCADFKPGAIKFYGDGTERLRITSGGYVNIGGQSTQTTHLLHLQGTGDAGIHIRADSDNSGENDNPYLSMSQDGSAAQELKIGQNGDAGQNFALSLANSPFIHANHSAAYPLQLAHMDTMCVFISSRHNELGLNNYSGNTTAGMEIQNRGNDTATALKLTGHNNSGTPGAETYTQLTHIGSNLTFEIMHAGSRALNIGNTRRIRVPGIVGVAGSGLQTVYVESDGNLCTTSSLREYKTNITAISDTSWLYNLNPVTFNWKKKTEVDGENIWEDTADDNGTQYGLIAEEVETVKKDFCSYDNNDKLTGVHYDRMIAPLIKALQEQKAEIDALKTRVATLEGS